jgi:CYTH domain-containing protein
MSWSFLKSNTVRMFSWKRRRITLKLTKCMKEGQELKVSKTTKDPIRLLTSSVPMTTQETRHMAAIKASVIWV